ncbi:MAG: Ig-like domain-containing protein [Myxococcota bacterium]
MILLPATEFMAPAPDATDVPVNTRIWVGAGEGGEDTMSVSGPHGPIHGTRTSLVSNLVTIVVFTPTEPLVPGETYVVTRPGGGSSTFRVGNARDHEAPPPPSVVSRRYEPDPEDTDAIPDILQDDSCSTCSAGTVFDLEHKGLFVVADLNRAQAETVAFNPGEHLGFAALGLTTEVKVSDAVACGGQGESVTRFGTVDLAGNFSGWSPDEDTHQGSSSCAASSGTGSWALFLLLRAARRRR